MQFPISSINKSEDNFVSRYNSLPRQRKHLEICKHPWNITLSKKCMDEMNYVDFWNLQ